MKQGGDKLEETLSLCGKLKWRNKKNEKTPKIKNNKNITTAL